MASSKKFFTDDMTAEIGNVHIILNRVGDLFNIDDVGDCFWSGEVFEPATTDQPIVCVANRIRSVSCDESGHWVTDDGLIMGRSSVGLAKREKIPLPYDIYGVGKKGEEAEVLRVRGRLYLNPRYLPMWGRIIPREGGMHLD